MVDDVVASTAASSAGPSREAIDSLTGSTSSSNSTAVASGAVDSLTFDGSLFSIFPIFSKELNKLSGEAFLKDVKNVGVISIRKLL